MKTIKHPPSIISIDTSVCIGVYDAYVYKYTNITNGKWYVGWHLGIFDGSYWHSSKDKEFLKIFSGSKPTLTLEILSTGLRIDMKNLESKILTDQKAKKNPLSYNGAGSPTGNKQPIDIDKCNEVIDIIEKRIRDEDYEIEDLDLIDSLRSLQVRDAAEEKSHTMRIREGMLETGLQFQKPILIWEGQDPDLDDMDIRGDGNHTMLALVGLNNFNEVKTIRMSREFCKKYQLNIAELRHIGLKMNPRKSIVDLETKDADVIKQLLMVLEQGTIIDPKKTEYGKDLCKSYGYKGKRPSALCNKASEIYKDSILAKSGLKRAKYGEDDKDNVRLLHRKADSLRNDKSIVVIGCTVYASKILKEVFDSVRDLKTYPDRPNIHLVCHHNGNDKSKKKWESGDRASTESIIKDIFKMMAPVTIEDDNGIKHEVPRTFTIHEMDHYQSDIQ